MHTIHIPCWSSLLGPSPAAPSVRRLPRTGASGHVPAACYTYIHMYVGVVIVRGIYIHYTQCILYMDCGLHVYSIIYEVYAVVKVYIAYNIDAKCTYN